MTLRRRLTALAVLGAAITVLAGCGAAGTTTAGGSAGANRTSTALATRTATAGPVGVTITPKRVDATGAVFAVELDNHSIDLDGDYAATSTLIVNGTAWTPARWSGDGPTGHHRSGTLAFTAAGAPAGVAELRLGGLPKPVTVRWTLPG